MNKLKLKIQPKLFSKEFLKKLPRLAAKHTFISFLVAFLFAASVGGVFFYTYGILAKKAEPEITEKPLQFNEKDYQGVLRFWEERQKRFEKAEFKEYPDLFRGQTSAGI